MALPICAPHDHGLEPTANCEELADIVPTAGLATRGMHEQRVAALSGGSYGAAACFDLGKPTLGAADRLFSSDKFTFYFMASPIFVFGVPTDPERFQLRMDESNTRQPLAIFEAGRRLKLTATELALVAKLVRQPRDTVSLDAIWTLNPGHGDTGDKSQFARDLLKHIRQVSPLLRTLIKAHKRVGYHLHDQVVVQSRRGDVRPDLHTAGLPTGSVGVSSDVHDHHPAPYVIFDNYTIPPHIDSRAPRADDNHPLQSDQAKTWAYPITKLLTSPGLKQTLARLPAVPFLCIDDGLLLWSRNDYSDVTPTHISVKIADISQYPDQLEHPLNRRELGHILELHNLSPRVATWLTSDFGKSVEQSLRDRRADRTKAGVLSLLPPTKSIDERAFVINVAPVSFWLIRRFNRLILDSPQLMDLIQLRDECLRELISPHEYFRFRFPSALYVELVLSLDDASVVVLRKSTHLSPLARNGHSLTCGIEEGITWSDVRANGLDFHRIALLGLQRELGIFENEVGEIGFWGVALATSHLNVGVLGYVRLKLSRNGFASKIQESDDYNEVVSFISPEMLDERLADSPVHSQWHPTARLRMLLLQYRRHSDRAAVDRRIAAIMDSPFRQVP